jgi:hypothetical protein
MLRCSDGKGTALIFLTQVHRPRLRLGAQIRTAHLSGPSHRSWLSERYVATTFYSAHLSDVSYAISYFFSHVHPFCGLRSSFLPYSVFPTGYNHSGKMGQINFLDGFMGLANAQRTLDYIRIITEFISQSEYKNVVPMFGIVNEAIVTTIGKPQLTSL